MTKTRNIDTPAKLIWELLRKIDLVLRLSTTQLIDKSSILIAVGNGFEAKKIETNEYFLICILPRQLAKSNHYLEAISSISFMSFSLRSQRKRTTIEHKINNWIHFRCLLYNDLKWEFKTNCGLGENPATCWFDG